MNKEKILMIILSLILIGILFILYTNFLQKNITGATIINQYSHTKAVCNETNYCQDYEIICKNGEVVSKNPITGAAIQNSADWKDPRSENQINRLC